MGSAQEQSEPGKGKVLELRSRTSKARRVLVVDDNLDTVHTMALMLKSMGHEVQFAINGFAALDIAREFRPDFILLDIGLPDFSGNEIARQVKWDRELAHTRIIAVTGRTDDEARERAAVSGCEGFLAKPVNPLTLERLLDR
jgi:CheY-like chemotaxis protein